MARELDAGRGAAPRIEPERKAQAAHLPGRLPGDRRLNGSACALASPDGVSLFPGWTVRIDGRSVEAGPASGSGRIEFGVPAGTHSVEVIGRSPARRWGEGIRFAVARRDRLL